MSKLEKCTIQQNGQWKLEKSAKTIRGSEGAPTTTNKDMGELLNHDKISFKYTGHEPYYHDSEEEFPKWHPKHEPDELNRKDKYWYHTHSYDLYHNGEKVGSQHFDVDPKSGHVINSGANLHNKYRRNDDKWWSKTDHIGTANREMMEEKAMDLHLNKFPKHTNKLSQLK